MWRYSAVLRSGLQLPLLPSWTWSGKGAYCCLSLLLLLLLLLHRCHCHCHWNLLGSSCGAGRAWHGPPCHREVGHLLRGCLAWSPLRGCTWRCLHLLRSHCCWCGGGWAEWPQRMAVQMVASWRSWKLQRARSPANAAGQWSVSWSASAVWNGSWADEAWRALCSWRGQCESGNGAPCSSRCRYWQRARRPSRPGWRTDRQSRMTSRRNNATSYPHPSWGRCRSVLLRCTRSLQWCCWGLKKDTREIQVLLWVKLTCWFIKLFCRQAFWKCFLSITLRRGMHGMTVNLHIIHKEINLTLRLIDIGSSWHGHCRLS